MGPPLVVLYQGSLVVLGPIQKLGFTKAELSSTSIGLLSELETIKTNKSLLNLCIFVKKWVLY